jgi:spermidine synthase
MSGERVLQQLETGSGLTPMQQHWLWRPGLIVFVSSACTMILELVAGRIVAPYVGVSLYTWTSVIGVVLAGMSLGNFLGGRLADRYASTGLLGGIFVLGGLSAFGILAADPVGSIIPGAWPIVVNILLLTAALFFLPCLILGMVSPVVAKLAVQDLARTGRTVGQIYALSTAGSIVGTFATGFVLISWFGTHAVVWGVGLVLLAVGLLFLLERRWRMMLLFALVLAGASVVVLSQGWTHGPCTLETNYFCIRVHDEEKEDGVVRVLVLDRLVHSYTSLDDPTRLVYGYERIYAEITDQRAKEDDHVRALFIGGGGYTFPKYMEALYPASDIDVIEIDPGVTQIAGQLLGLAADTRIVTYNEDARMFLARAPADRYDLIVGDAFNDFSVPYHLTTREFNERVRAWLVDDGLYMVNIIDGAGGEFLRSYTHTLRQSFAHLYLVPTIDSWRQSPRSTFVLVASDVPVDMSSFEGGGSGSLLLRHVLSEEEVDQVLAEGRMVTLTDRYAPVDQMLAPVFRDEVPE